MKHSKPPMAAPDDSGDGQAGDDWRGIAAGDPAEPPAGSTDPGEAGEPAELLDLASRILAVRNERGRHFDASLFGEPAWNMLLELFLNEGGGAVPAICAASGAPARTAVRWLKALGDQGLVSFSGGKPEDEGARAALTAAGKARLRAYLEASARISAAG